MYLNPTKQLNQIDLEEISKYFQHFVEKINRDEEINGPDLVDTFTDLLRRIYGVKEN